MHRLRYYPGSHALLVERLSFIPSANVAGVEPLIPALAAIFDASYGFMLPVSTPPNAVVYGSDMIPITKMGNGSR